MRERLSRAKQIVWPDNQTIYDRVAEGHADVFVSDSIEVVLHAQLDPRLCAPIQGTNRCRIGHSGTSLVRWNGA